MSCKPTFNCALKGREIVSPIIQLSWYNRCSQKEGSERFYQDSDD